MHITPVDYHKFKKEFLSNGYSKFVYDDVKSKDMLNMANIENIKNIVSANIVKTYMKNTSIYKMLRLVESMDDIKTPKEILAIADKIEKLHKKTEKELENA